jgi:hypothetical protein
LISFTLQLLDLVLKGLVGCLHFGDGGGLGGLGGVVGFPLAV